MPVMLSLELVKKIFEGASIALKAVNKVSDYKEENVNPPTLHRMKPTSRMMAIRSLKSGIGSLD
jgi:hypothetical protein